MSEPVPVPTSSTTSSAVSSAASTISCTQIEIDEKILPMPRRGADAHFAEALDQKGFGLAGHVEASAFSCQRRADGYAG